MRNFFIFILFLFPSVSFGALYTTSSSINNAVERSDDVSFTTDPVASLGAGLVYGRSGAGGSPFWYSGFRFNGISIAQGTTITSAKMTFTAKSNFSMTSGISVDIFGEDVDDSDDFSTTPDVVNRTRTTANATWSAPNTGTTDVAVDTVDITSVVQEIIDRAGWVSGNDLTILFRQTAGTAGESANYYFYADSAVKSATLTIETGGGGGGGGGGGSSYIYPDPTYDLSTGSATSSLEQTQQNLFNSFILFWLTFVFIIWFFKKQNA